MFKKALLLIALVAIESAYAYDGPYLGAGGGFGFQNVTSSASGASPQSSLVAPAVRATVGYGFTDYLNAEAGYTYFFPGQNLTNIGNTSATIYDASIVPEFMIPYTKILIFGRLGIDEMTSGANISCGSQLTNSMHTGFEYGGGIDLRGSSTGLFFRAEYINFGGTPVSNVNNTSDSLSAVLFSLGYNF